MEQELEPCPFCGDTMFSGKFGDTIQHVQQTPGCPLAAIALPIERAADWNTRANLSSDDARDAWPIGMRVTKTKGSSWTGKIVGHYSTNLTPVGVAVESENEPGSVQIYPVTALRALKGTGHE